MVFRIFLVAACLCINSRLVAQTMHATPKIYVFRLKPHEDLKRSILRFAKDHDVRAGIMVTCVGSLEQVNLRYANQEQGVKKNGHFEIVSLTGTLSASGAHLHLAVADSTGVTTGGHLLDDNLVYTTAEIAIAELPELNFERTPDPTYGYQELLVSPRKKIGKP
jgi:predicted DNA-binding protein with PD1-like motif